MSESCSPVKVGPPDSKRERRGINWSQCIICQKYSSENLTNFGIKGKCSFIEALELRKDDVYTSIISEISSLSEMKVESFEMKYHKSCFKSYTSKHNLKAFSKNVSICEEKPELSSLNIPGSSITTRSNWDSCIFCKNKTFKKDTKLHKLETEERKRNILEVAKRKSDSEIEHLVLHEHFIENGLYHSPCMRNYLLRTGKINDSEETESFIHETAFHKFISLIHEDLIVKYKAFFMSSLLSLYQSFLPEDISDKYTTYRLQCRLQTHYGDAIFIQKQQGQSNIVFNSSISVGHAIKAANRLKVDLKIAETELKTKQTSTQNDDQILYSAVSILKRDIKNLDISNTFYPLLSSEVSLPC